MICNAMFLKPKERLFKIRRTGNVINVELKMHRMLELVLVVLQDLLNNCINNIERPQKCGLLFFIMQGEEYER